MKGVRGDGRSALSHQAEAISRAYGRGAVVEPMALVARGEQGRVWRLATADGTYAVKELLIRQTPADAAADVAYQEAVLATGSVPLPTPVRGFGGQVLLDVAGRQVRLYEWVDLLPTDTRLDPAMVGATLAAIHRVHYAPARPLHPWYTEPVGPARWAELLGRAQAAAAPFVDALAEEIPVLLRLEGLMEPPTDLQNCHRDLWADNVLPTSIGGVCVIDWENCGLEDPAQELPMSFVDFGAGDPHRIARLYRSYLDAGGPARVHGYGSSRW
ncbi:MAG: phosphotransferase enzyme family protein [Actinomycetes bacterium]